MKSEELATAMKCIYIYVAMAASVLLSLSVVALGVSGTVAVGLVAWLRQ